MKKLVFSVAIALCGLSTVGAQTFEATSYGAKCDGTTDDTAALQAAMNAAAAAGGGTVTLPNSTCLLNSTSRSPHPWMFYNLRIPSGVTISGTGTNSKLVQGPGGRHGLVPGATYAGNAVLSAGNFAATAYNQATFYALNAITAGNTSVTLSTAGDASNFAVGDVITVYETNPAVTNCDVCATSIVTKVASSNSSTGVVGLADNLLRTFATPFMAKVTSTTTHDVAISNLIVQGVEPLAAAEVYNFTSTNVQYLTDTTISLNLLGLQLNTIAHGTWTGNTIDLAPGATAYYSQEWPQRNSYKNRWSGNTIRAASFGGGEYAGNITLTGNHMYLETDGTGGNFALGGMNVKFDSNDVHTVGNQTAAAPWGSIITDVNAPSGYFPYVGNVQITNNTIQCQADGNQCIIVLLNGDTVSGNTLCITGSAIPVSNVGQNNTVSNNTLSCAPPPPAGL